ncbi:MAG: hypothetical protein ABIJ31_07785 [Pseudomonadota bacterium]
MKNMTFTTLQKNTVLFFAVFILISFFQVSFAHSADTHAIDLNIPGFKVFLSVEHDEKPTITMDAVKLNTYWTGNYINAIYHYEKNQIELGFGTHMINKLLPDNMKMEIKTNPQAGTAVILFSVKL